MQFSTTIAALGLLATSALAQRSDAAPFTLYATSLSSSKYNNTILSACHEGAGPESLCILANPTTTATFIHNTTNGGQSIVAGNSKSGGLIFNPGNLPSYFSVFTDYSTNVGQGQFGGVGQLTYISFDSADSMNTVTVLDDTVSPTTETYTQGKALYDWFVCETNYGGYIEPTVNWVFGGVQPHNPSCERVDVVRHFV